MTKIIDLSKPQSFRWGNPPKQVMQHLEMLKKESSKKFSSWIPHYITLGVELELNQGKPHVLIPLDADISKEELDFFQSDYAKNLLSILFKAITKDPSKAFQLLENQALANTVSNEPIQQAESKADAEIAAQEEAFKILEENADDFDLGI